MNKNILPHTVLKRTNDVVLTLQSVNVVKVSTGQKSRNFSNHALSLLNIFARPLSITDALKEITVNSKQEWVQVTSTLYMLLEIGALTTADESQFIPDKNNVAFGAAPIHITMLNDKTRTDAFIKGIGEIVKAGDIVVDIGTGTGVLAIAAARAGAKRVYAIEASAIADVAQDVINRTEVADRITLIRGLSTAITLPEQADVLISEIIGNDPFAENVLPVFKDAKQRLLKADARILPGMIRIYAVPVKIPAARLQNTVLQPQDLENWKTWYGIDLQILNDSIDLSQPLWRIKEKQLHDFSFAEETLCLAEVPFSTFNEAVICEEIPLKKQGDFNGMLIYFDLQLGDTLLTNDPRAAVRACHWLNLVWYLPAAEKAAAGAQLTIQYRCSGKKSTLQLLAAQG